MVSQTKYLVCFFGSSRKLQSGPSIPQPKANHAAQRNVIKNFWAQPLNSRSWAELKLQTGDPNAIFCAVSVQLAHCEYMLCFGRQTGCVTFSDTSQKLCSCVLPTNADKQDQIWGNSCHSTDALENYGSGSGGGSANDWDSLRDYHYNIIFAFKFTQMNN